MLGKEELKADHGDQWESVNSILSGKAAKSPEAIMRARYTALKFKDVNFLAATEMEEGVGQKERAKAWSVALGLEELDFFSNLFTSNDQKDMDSLRDVSGFEVVKADGETVEFKIRCKDGKVLHEKSYFEANKKWGFVFSGKSEFGKWSS